MTAIEPPNTERDEMLPRRIVDRLKRILIIDDDEFVCKVIAAHLRGLCNAEISLTYGDRDTVKILNEDGPFDLIVSDLSMPKFDGIQLMRLVVARQANATMLFISSAGRKLLAAARELACNRGLSVLPPLEKPVSRKDLHRVCMLIGETPQTVQHRPVVATPSVNELQDAIKNFEISIYVQPQVYPATGKLHGVEALARWNSKHHGFVPPDIFIKMAEEHHLIDELTEQVLRMSLGACASWRARGLETRISVNAPTSSLSNLMLPDTVSALIERYRLRPEQLTIEVTETGIVQDLRRALDVLARLRLRGIGLAIDDFGCGHSTFQQIQRMPFNELKIDCSFVMNMFSDPDSCSIVRSSLNLARELNMHTVAEGVETLAHWQALGKMNCDILQGYYIAKPFPADELPAWLERFQSHHPMAAGSAPSDELPALSAYAA